MLHTARHLSLACVEILVQLDKSELPRDYVWSWAELRVTPSNLEWSDLSHVSSCQAGARGSFRRVSWQYRCPSPDAGRADAILYFRDMGATVKVPSWRPQPNIPGLIQV